MSNLENYKNLPSSDFVFKTLMKKKENLQALIEAKYPELGKRIDFDNIAFIDTENYNTQEQLKTHYYMACETNLKNAKEKIEPYFIFEHKSYSDKYISAQLVSYVSSKFNESKIKRKEIPKTMPGTLKLFLIEIYKTNRVDFEQWDAKLLELSQGDIDMKNLIEDAMEYAKREGKMEGKIEGARDVIIDMVKNYFHQDDITDIENKINHINDYDKLKDLTFKIFTFKSIEELRGNLENS